MVAMHPHVEPHQGGKVPSWNPQAAVLMAAHLCAYVLAYEYEVSQVDMIDSSRKWVYQQLIIAQLSQIH